MRTWVMPSQLADGIYRYRVVAASFALPRRHAVDAACECGMNEHDVSSAERAASASAIILASDE